MLFRSQEELGHLLGKSRQSIAKLLRLWEQDGLVETRYGRVFIEKPDVLTGMAYPDRQLPPPVPRNGTSLFKEMS